MRGPGRRRKMAKGGVCPRAAQRHGGGGKWATVHRAQKVVRPPWKVRDNCGSLCQMQGNKAGPGGEAGPCAGSASSRAGVGPGQGQRAGACLRPPAQQRGPSGGAAAANAAPPPPSGMERHLTSQCWSPRPAWLQKYFPKPPSLSPPRLGVGAGLQG